MAGLPSECRSDSGSAPGSRPPLVADGGTGGRADSGADTSGADSGDRRRLIMYLLAIAIAIPIIVEGLTLAGLVGSYLGDGATPGPSPTPTPTAPVTEGAELLPDTDRSEQVSTVTLRSTSDGWTLTVTVLVENTGDLPYELRLGAVTTDGGRRVEASATTGRVTPGGSASVSAQWQLPAGDRPRTLAVKAVEYDDGEQTLVDREVRVGRVPVQG